ncbi:hypothetical protein Pst134EA_007623 [Puccinia striiformis f. sp. tritici]|uniref:hypothetical protein n=1 Tax=Puccinia striiformis f. sp. tritici TaxID=168172 RepID=UPI0020089258|nr:hypothetical protein Pst134EA_007623 [Puccinia striiformis f. sp. tritici]KAH9470359.1 hypothetical protein Pst134EA_007623 [Puccinia striiformis f. sp. tritici]KAI9624926.1 hypothetical protein KEM48_008648 [Puccinia striiformis f. sp. tritici PST-130]
MVNELVWFGHSFRGDACWPRVGAKLVRGSQFLSANHFRKLQSEPMDQSEESLQKLVSEYQELNDSAIDEITHRLPTALELSRSIASNRPLVIRSYAGLQVAPSSAEDGQYHRLQPSEEWTDSKLIQKLGDKLITVARTPYGNADSIVDGKYFVEPAYEKVTMADFLAELRATEGSMSQDPLANTSTTDNAQSAGPRGDVVYLQSQDGNLSKELLPLLPDVGTDVPIASQALGTNQPDAVNLWIGDDRSVTSLHNDPYENFYLIIEGSKTFTLFPPVENYCMHEGNYISSKYHWDELQQKWMIVPKQPDKEQTVPWIPVDPLKPDYTNYPRFRFARPMSVTLHQGDLLYLPSLWYHHVQAHKTTPNSLIIACNWWYDMNYEGAHYALFSYLRRQVLALDKPGHSELTPEEDGIGNN